MRARIKISASRLLLSPRVNRWFSSRIVRLAGSPMLHDIYVNSTVLTTSPTEAAEAVLGDSADYTEEFGRLRDRLEREMADADRNYPDFFGVEDSTALLLYTLVREAKPSLALEVGVANGRSTQVILSALDANQSGRLISVDIDPEVGGPARGHPRWSLRVHSPEISSSRQLRDLLQELGAPDFFFHDALHTYADQYREYLVAAEHMRPGGLFIGDDIDMSFAFLDLMRALDVKPVALTDRRKVVGAFRHP